ncbi:coagulation factor 5/8 type domain-containing protein [Tunturiibacter gelidiferens]|uniref:coagulation factor 5/8 type domain-containing protein n=1 Tax=Tunturiibacter gelidiferens TaxID=3069689 RepID=UPI003D9B52DC
MKYTTSKTSTAKLPFARLVGTLLLSVGVLSGSAVAQNTSDLGSNVYIFDPSMPTSQIQATVDSIANQQVSNQFGTQRYALLFKPGVYGSAATPLNFKVGFYTEVAGLGASPDDVVINGSIDVYNQCFGPNNCIALDNFWRSLSNLAINVNTPNFGCYSGEFWAVSQAAPMRRVHITGNTTLMDYCSGPSFASGGFIANTQTGSIVNGSQQQFYVRNSNIGSWSNGVWNQVFSGVIGAPAQSYPNPTYTTLSTTPVTREKPFLFVDASGNYNVFAPAAQTNTSGTNWVTTSTAGRTLPISNFFIATPSTSVQQINARLASGQNLILTPGVYQLDRSIDIKKPDTVVLALGDATLVPQNGTAAITIAAVDGVQVAGLIVDAGPVQSPVLFQIGKPNGKKPSDPSDPVTLNDVFFRIGGATQGSAVTSLQIDHDNVLLDDIWAWRADHGAGVGWIVNTADHGLVVNGDNVTATGLFVEHYQKEQVLWNGNGGETIFYQSELPYDPPSQSAWTDGTANGYPSYAVSNSATTHQAYGLGIYSFFNQGINIIEDNAMTVPNASGVAIHDVGTVWLNGSGQITHVINGQGATVSSSNADTLSPVVFYP